MPFTAKNVQTLLLLYTIFSGIIAVIFYAQNQKLAYAFLPPDAVSGHTMRLGGLLFGLIFIVNLSAVLSSRSNGTKQHTSGDSSSSNNATAPITLALICNAVVLIHYSLEALYYHALNPIIYMLLIVLSAMSLSGLIQLPNIHLHQLEFSDSTAPKQD